MTLSDEAVKVLDYVVESLAIHGDTGRRLSDIQRETKLTDEQCRNAFAELHGEALINLIPGPEMAWYCVPLMTNIATWVLQQQAERN